MSGGEIAWTNIWIQISHPQLHFSFHSSSVFLQRNEIKTCFASLFQLFVQVSLFLHSNPDAFERFRLNFKSICGRRLRVSSLLCLKTFRKWIIHGERTMRRERQESLAHAKKGRINLGLFFRCLLLSRSAQKVHEELLRKLKMKQKAGSLHFLCQIGHEGLFPLMRVAELFSAHRRRWCSSAQSSNNFHCYYRIKGCFRIATMITFMRLWLSTSSHTLRLEH